MNELFDGAGQLFWRKLWYGLVVLALLFLCLLLGIFIGYVVLGKGPFWEVFNVDTWRHITDFIFH